MGLQVVGGDRVLTLVVKHPFPGGAVDPEGMPSPALRQTRFQDKRQTNVTAAGAKEPVFRKRSAPETGVFDLTQPLLP